ncbi:hypothetical protein BJX62DRAFT_232485 [Aspergillus germanicus]
MIRPVPVPTPVNTTSKCGEYYLVEPGEDCGIVTTRFEIPLDDLQMLRRRLDMFNFVQPVSEPSGLGELHKSDAGLLLLCAALWVISGPILGTAGRPQQSHLSRPRPSTPLPKDPVASYPSSWPIIPIANRTRRDCHSYISFENVTENVAANCWNLAAIVSASREEFVLWNPSLGDNSTSFQHRGRGNNNVDKRPVRVPLHFGRKHLLLRVRRTTTTTTNHDGAGNAHRNAGPACKQRSRQLHPVVRTGRPG